MMSTASDGRSLEKWRIVHRPSPSKTLRRAKVQAEHMLLSQTPRQRLMCSSCHHLRANAVILNGSH
jgi:hypothetical protein